LTHYDDPAPLGGSFIVTCAQATENTATMRALRANGGAFFANDQQEDRLPALRQTVKGVCDEIIAMISESLKAGSPAEWFEYWRSNNDVYDNLSRSLTHLASELGLSREKMLSLRNRDVAAERFPEAEDELAFIRGIVHNAISQAQQFNEMPLREELKPKDFQAYCRFRYYGSVFSSCIVSLEYLGYHPDVPVQTDVLEAIFAEARSAALQFNHAVMEAGRLREPPDEGDYPDVEPIAIPDDDLVDVETAISKFEGQAEA
jgi:hypothetical protein